MNLFFYFVCFIYSFIFVFVFLECVRTRKKNSKKIKPQRFQIQPLPKLGLTSQAYKVQLHQQEKQHHRERSRKKQVIWEYQNQLHKKMNNKRQGLSQEQTLKMLCTVVVNELDKRLISFIYFKYQTCGEKLVN